MDGRDFGVRCVGSRRMDEEDVGVRFGGSRRMDGGGLEKGSDEARERTKGISGNERDDGRSPGRSREPMEGI